MSGSIAFQDLALGKDSGPLDREKLPGCGFGS